MLVITGSGVKDNAQFISSWTGFPSWKATIRAETYENQPLLNLLDYALGYALDYPYSRKHLRIALNDYINLPMPCIQKDTVHSGDYCNIYYSDQNDPLIRSVINHSHIRLNYIRTPRTVEEFLFLRLAGVFIYTERMLLEHRDWASNLLTIGELTLDDDSVQDVLNITQGDMKGRFFVKLMPFVTSYKLLDIVRVFPCSQEEFNYVVDERYKGLAPIWISLSEGESIVPSDVGPLLNK